MAKKKVTPVTEPVVEATVVEETNEVVEAVLFDGTVIECEKLRIREVPNGEIVTVVDCGTKLTCKESDDTEWFAVTLGDGTVGFAMKQFISIK